MRIVDTSASGGCFWLVLPLPNHRRFTKQLLLRMKLTFILVLIACLQVSAGSYAQRITLSEKNASLQKIFQEVKKQTGYSFLYSTEVIRQARKVDIDVRDASIEYVLRICFANQVLTWEMEGKTIIIKPRAAETTPRNDDATAIQAAQIKGQVTGQDGTPLSNATISLKGTNKSWVSAADGSFDINTPESSGILVVSYVGYISQEVPFKASSGYLSVKMVAADNVSEDIVLVGYSKSRKQDLTGAVSSVREKDLQSRPVASFQDALVGRASGVNVSQTGGNLDGKFNIVIRGAGAITTSSGPLIIVDGVTTTGSSLNAINPKDIVSIDVLKDASATSIYGAQASNGVLLITTRRGKAGKTLVTFNTELGSESISKMYKVLSTEQQRRLFVEAFKNSGRNTTAYENPADAVWQTDNNWQELATRSALRQNYNIQVSGGDAKSRFAVSGGFLKREGVLKNTDITDFFLRANNDINVGSKLKITSSFMTTYQIYNQPQRENDIFNSGGLYERLVSQHSYNPAFDAEGNLAGVQTAADPYFGASSNPLIPLYLFKNQSKNTKILASLKLDYEIVKGLTLSGSSGVDLALQNINTYTPTYSIGLNKQDYGIATAGSVQQYNWVTDITLEYQKTIGLHAAKLLVGASAQQQRYVSTNTEGWGTTDNSLDQLANQQNFSAKSSDITSGLASTFARLNYGFDERYLLTATVRRDGSSKFGSANRYGVFPSASVAWRIAREDFFKVAAINDLKLRVSYGLTGNQNIGDFGFLSQVTAANYVYGNTTAGGNVPGNISNPALQWESAKQLDAGIDISLFGSRLNLTLDYYQKKSENLLINIPMPLTSGVTSQATNFGAIKNNGVEFAVNSRNLTGNFSWTTDFNIAYNKNRVLNAGTNSVGGELTIPGTTLSLPNDFVNLTAAGYPVGAFNMYRFIGIWQQSDQQEAAAAGAVPGDVRYADLNKNGILDPGDKEYVGSPQPTYYGGLNNTWSYKKFSLNVFINFSGGNKLYNTMRNLNARAVPFNQQLAEVADFWTPDNPSNSVPRPSQGGNTTFLATRVSTRFLEDAGFARLKNISLAYELSPSLLDRLKLQHARIAISCINAITITKYKGLDPEASSSGNLLSAGQDITPYPPTRQFNLSVSLTF